MRWRGYAVDVAIALAAFALSVFLLDQPGATDPDARPANLGAYVLLAAFCGSVTIRRRYPLAAAVTVLASGFAYAAASYPRALTVAGLLPLYTAATRLPAKLSRRLLVAATVVSAIGATLGPGPTSTSVPIVVAGVWLLGYSVRNRQEYTEELARRAVAEERLRIARELHDVVAHTMSVVAVHAGTGRLVAKSDPAGAERALETIETTARSAMAEMRQLLGVLRSDGEAVGERSPAPGLDDLEDLVAGVAGPAVHLRVEGERASVSPGVDLSAYRVVQEALTNAIKHAGASRAMVTVRYDHDAVTVTVEDDGVGGKPASGGHGLVGMRERVAVHGGTLEAGPRPGGGFRVEARFPS